MTDDQQREAVARAIGDARWGADWLGTPDAQLLREADAALSALAPVQPDPLRARVEREARAMENLAAFDEPSALAFGLCARSLRALLAETEAQA